MKTPGLDDRFKQVRAHLHNNDPAAAHKAANDCMSTFVSNREQYIKQDELELLAKALEFTDATSFMGRINGMWAQKSYGVRLALEWVEVAPVNGGYMAAKVHYIAS